MFLNLTNRRVSDAWCESFLSLNSSGECEGVLLDELEWGAEDSCSAPCRDRTMSGVEDDKDMPLARFLCSSNIFMPGNGNNFASLYLSRSAVDAGGMGDTPLLGGVCGGSDNIEVEADDDCMTTCCCCCS